MIRSFRSMLVLVVALFAAGGHASAQAAEEDVPVREPRDHTYTLGVGMHGTRIRAEDGMRMGMAGPALVGSYFVGRDMGFMLRGEMSFPVHGQMHLEGESSAYNLRTRYEAFRLNFDALFMFAYRLRPTENVDVVLAGGIHVQTVRLVSGQYMPIEAITGGIGGLARVERRFGTRFFYAGEMALGLDPIDFVKHENRIVVTFPMTASFMMGIRR